MRSGFCGFESHSGHLIFSGICSVYIDRYIRVDLSDDEQFLDYEQSLFFLSPSSIEQNMRECTCA